MLAKYSHSMKFILAPVLILFSLTVFAQQNHFIYIQSDNQQAFYVKLNKKILSSSANGYLIIPKLREGAYDLAIGFPKNEWPEQNVTCSVETTDAGYLLKNFGEKGWGLFNFQTMNLLMADSKPRTDSSKLNDAFANTLSSVVNDPGIVKTETKTEDTVTQLTEKKEPGEKTLVKKEPKSNSKIKITAAAAKKKNTISKLAVNKGTDSLSMVYIDKTKGKADTINVIIPVEDMATAQKPEKKNEDLWVSVTKPDDKVVPNVTDTIAVVIREKKAEDLPVSVIAKPGDKITPIVIDTLAVVTSENNTAEKTETKKANKRQRKPANKKNTGSLVNLAKTEIKKEPDSAVAIVSDTQIKPDNRSTELLADTVKTGQPKNVEEPKTGIVKETPKNIEAPVKDTVQQKTEATIITPPVIQTNIPEKKEEIVAVLPVKEKIVENTSANPNLARPVAACRVYVDDDEYLNLRKKMDKEKKNENEMLYLAHKVFEKKCFNTRQIQRLSLLFTTDQGKYKLFDDAYQYTYDAENFPSLLSELTDDYYKKRFRAMLR